jgi:hypothetical protein
MMAQDDVLYNHNSRQTWEKELEKDNSETGYWSLYLASKHKDLTKRKDHGFHRHMIGWCFWGALCYIFPREAAKELLTNETFLKLLSERHKNIDCIVGSALLTMEKKMYFHFPSLTNHIGYSSTVGHNHFNLNEGYLFQ